MKREFKVIKTTHQYSRLKEHLAYAIVTSIVMTAENDAVLGTVNLDDDNDDDDDGYIIATNIQHASDLLNSHIIKNSVGEKDFVPCTTCPSPLVCTEHRICDNAMLAAGH